ncbi:hypothetical protein [Lapidilactobacillus luobeiensis]|uniref:hypothetical protein n=1 Tax=Lapidilactobacillus luobeiensis TaxID=2950371 RepID=UPI0021C39658|nr:hypothetical protein [Lapidilactobacillus luobeiensis]
MGFLVMIGAFFAGLVLVVLSFQEKIRRHWPQYLLLLLGSALIIVAIKLAL